MAVKLGELLVKAGLISPTDLDEALNSQIIFGGRLGTNLLEMGCLHEAELARFLSKVAGVPAVKPEQLQAVPPQIIGLVPAAIAEKYRIIPLSLTQRRLTVAMADPTDFAAIDELAFATGFIIIPMVASEVSIERCLETYYEIKRQRRSLYMKGKGRQREKQPEAALVEELPENSGVAYEEPGLIEFPPAEEFKGFHLDEPSTTDPWGEIAVEEEAPSKISSQLFSSRLAEANDRDAVVDLLLTYAGQFFARAAVFIVKGGSIRGWKILNEQRLEDLKGVEVPLDSPSVLRQVVQEKTFYLGPIANTAAHRQMVAAIGGKRPSQVLLVPMQILKRVVAILYVDGPITPMGENIIDIQKAASKATMALEILILKSKITMT